MIIEDLSEHASVENAIEPAMPPNTEDAPMDTEQVVHIPPSKPSVISEATASMATTGPRPRRTRAAAPISTTEVRRSLRSNTYDGVKVPPLSDSRKNNSKVKPRVIPSIGTSASAATSAGEVPPPTPIVTLQSIGVNRCATPATELSEEALLAETSAVPKSSASSIDSDDQGEDLSHTSA